MHLSKAATALACAALLACAGRDGRTATGSGPDPREIWIRDVTLISPERAQPLLGAHVHLRAGRIAWIGTTRPPDLAPGATEIDGVGRFLVPGLIDGHVHLGEVPGIDPEQAGAMQGAIEAYFRQLPRSYLYFGFTALVDLSVIDRERIASLRAAAIGPAIFDCDGGLPIANGYPMALLPRDVRFSAFSNFLHDARQADAMPPSYRPAEHTPTAAVARVASAGGICVKTYFEPAGGLPVPTAELVREVVAASHARHLPVLLHANSRRMFREAGGAGTAAARYFVGHGGRLLFGSDTPSDATYANPPGYNGYLELRELEKAGISPRQILDAATRANAAFFHLDRDLGTIEAGKRDSLLLLRANPLESTSAFDTIELVIVGGVVVPRASLASSRP